MYNNEIVHNNMTYSVDMIRFKTYMTYSDFSEIEFRFNTVWEKYVKKKWNTGRAKEFFYNYNIEVGEGINFWFGFLHNSEKKSDSNYSKYNFTIEFNPNKLKDNKIILYLLGLSGEWYLKSLDLAVDLSISILDIIYDMSGRGEEKIISRGYDNKTIYLGKGSSRIKIYNKKKESNLNIQNELTRVEMSVDYEDFNISKIKTFKFEDIFPSMYVNNYIYSLGDYDNKILLAVLFAVQNGFPLRDLTRTYKNKIKDLLEGGQKIRFSVKTADEVIRRTIFYYFMKNYKVKWM